MGSPTWPLAVFFAVVAGSVMPEAGRLIALSFLVLPSPMSRSARLTLAVVACFFAAVTVSSRSMGESLADDFTAGYFPVYEAFSSGDSKSILRFGDGYEIGFTGVLWSLASLPFKLSPAGLMGVLVFLNLIILILWLEFLAFRRSSFRDSEKGLGHAMLVACCSVLLASQVMRQFYASAFVLCSLYFDRPAKKVAFGVIAAAFHLTSLPILGLIYAARKWPKLTYVIPVILGVSTFSNISGIINELSVKVGQGVGASKLAYYQQGISGVSGTANIGFISIVLLSIGAIFFLSKSGAEDKKDWRNVYYIFLLLIVALLPLPLASLRFTLLVNSVALGYLLFIAIARNYYPLVRLAAIMFFIFNVLRSARQDPADPFRLWATFDFVGLPPGYFLGL